MHFDQTDPVLLWIFYLCAASWQEEDGKHPEECLKDKKEEHGKHPEACLKDRIEKKRREGERERECERENVCERGEAKELRASDLEKGENREIMNERERGVDYWSRKITK